MKIIETKIPDLLLLEPNVFKDKRGWFMESFNQQAFEQALTARNLNVPSFAQDNHSLSHQGVLRGLHYQLNPHAQGKLVRVVQGKVWDVAVDIRQGSQTFGQWVGVELSAENHRAFWIPAGFAHGFIALEDNTQFLYKTTAYYHPLSERTLRWDDPKLAIDWPMNNFSQINIDQKDQLGKTFVEAEAAGDFFI